MTSLQSHLLVAVPRLPDSNFFRTVVLLLHHDEEGAFGVILNRPSEVSLREVWAEIANRPCDCDKPINHGGPVEGPLIALHTQEDCAENTILSDVFVSTQKENLNTLVSENRQPFRVFSGYAGWGREQLEGEIQAGGWLTTKAKRDFIFGDHEDLWQSVADSIGKNIVLSDVSNRGIPNDPSMN